MLLQPTRQAHHQGAARRQAAATAVGGAPHRAAGSSPPLLRRSSTPPRPQRLDTERGAPQRRAQDRQRHPASPHRTATATRPPPTPARGRLPRPRTPPPDPRPDRRSGVDTTNPDERLRVRSQAPLEPCLTPPERTTSSVRGHHSPQPPTPEATKTATGTAAPSHLRRRNSHWGSTHLCNSHWGTAHLSSTPYNKYCQSRGDSHNA